MRPNDDIKILIFHLGNLKRKVETEAVFCWRPPRKRPRFSLFKPLNLSKGIWNKKFIVKVSFYQKPFSYSLFARKKIFWDLEKTRILALGPELQRERFNPKMSIKVESKQPREKQTQMSMKKPCTKQDKKNKSTIGHVVFWNLKEFKSSRPEQF